MSEQNGAVKHCELLCSEWGGNVRCSTSGNKMLWAGTAEFIFVCVFVYSILEANSTYVECSVGAHTRTCLASGKVSALCALRSELSNLCAAQTLPVLLERG